MKFKIKDQVIITAGKDKGKKGKIIKVLPQENKVVVAGLNLYTKHIKKRDNKAGEIQHIERPFNLAKIAIINDQGKKDRIGYIFQEGTKKRIFKKTQQIIEDKK